MKKIKGMILKINNGIAEIAIDKKKDEICILVPEELEQILQVGQTCFFDYENGILTFHAAKEVKK